MKLLNDSLIQMKKLNYDTKCNFTNWRSCFHIKSVDIKPKTTRCLTVRNYKITKSMIQSLVYLILLCIFYLLSL